MRITPDFSHVGHCGHVIYRKSVCSRDTAIWCDECGTIVLVKDAPIVAVFRCRTCSTKWTGGKIAAQGRYVKHRKNYPDHVVYVSVNGKVEWQSRHEENVQMELPIRGRCPF